MNPIYFMLALSLAILGDSWSFEVQPSEPSVFTVVASTPEPPKDTSDYFVFFTAPYCGHCHAWKDAGNIEKLQAAGYRVRIVDVTTEPKWAGRVTSLPSFWLVDGEQRTPIKKWVGVTSVATLTTRSQSVSSSSATPSIYGFKGTSHESRTTLINHLMSDGIHRGKHTRKQLNAMTDEQLNSLHEFDHR